MNAGELIALLQEIPADSTVVMRSYAGESGAWIDAYEGGGEIAGRLLNNEREFWWVFLGPAARGRS